MVRTVKKPAERRQEIIAAARELFQTREYKKTTMQDVMQKLDIAKGTIYHYFKSKEELLAAVVENIVEEDIAHKQALLQKISGNALDKIRTLIKADSLAEDHEEILAHLHHPGNVGMHTRLLAVAIEKQARLYESLFRQGCEEGIFETEHPLECAEFILAGIQFLTDEGLHPWTQADLMRRAKAFPALIEALLQAPKGSFSFLTEQL